MASSPGIYSSLLPAHEVIFTWEGKREGNFDEARALKGHGKKWRRYLADFDNRLVRYICANSRRSDFVGVLRNNLSNGNEEILDK